MKTLIRWMIVIGSGNMPDPFYLVVEPSIHHWTRTDATLVWTLDKNCASKMEMKTARSLAFRVGHRWPRFRSMVQIVEMP